MKILDGKALAGFIKERQAAEVRGLSRAPRLLIVRDSENLVILKYVGLKKRYGDDIGVEVSDYFAKNSEEIRKAIKHANENPEIDGMILQLPILEKERTDELTALITPEKDVDGLSGRTGAFDSATATAIHWLIAGYDIDLKQKKIAIVGRGKLVGAPLYEMWTKSGYDVSLFHHGSDLSELYNFDVIVTATGRPGLITSEMVRAGTCLIDAGTASEGGVLKGDVADEVRKREDLLAITPKIGGVGPLTVTCLFDHVIQAAKKNS